MNITQNIPPYREREPRRGHERDVAGSEIRNQAKRLKKERARGQKLKKQYARQKKRRQQAEYKLQMERASRAQREMRIQLQTKLNDLAFYQSTGGGMAD